MTSRIAVLGIAVAALSTVAACASTTAPRPVRSDPVRPAGALTPSIPSVFTSGTNACGNPYAVAATSVERTVPLLDCPGQAGARPLAALTVSTGQQVLISGVGPGFTITLSPAGLLRRRGETYTALRPGHELFVVHHYPFCSAPSGPDACPLLDVTIVQP